MKLLFAFTFPNGMELYDLHSYRCFGREIDHELIAHPDGAPWKLSRDFWSKKFRHIEGFDDEISFRAARGFDVSGNRNWCVNRGVSYLVKQTDNYIFDFDALIFIDSDIEFTKKDILMLLDDHHDFPDAVIGGCYQSRRGDGYTAGSFTDPDRISFPITESGFHKVDYIGAGFSIVPRKVFETLQYPWYWTFYEDTKVPDGTPEGALARYPVADDIYFCKQCKWEGIEVYIDADIILKHHL